MFKTGIGHFRMWIGKCEELTETIGAEQASRMLALLDVPAISPLFDAKRPCGPEANAAKFLATEAGFQACDRAMQYHGGYSYATEYHVERYWRESRLLKIAPISQEMVLNFISDKVLGLPKSY